MLSRMVVYIAMHRGTAAELLQYPFYIDTDSDASTVDEKSSSVSVIASGNSPHSHFSTSDAEQDGTRATYRAASDIQPQFNIGLPSPVTCTTTAPVQSNTKGHNLAAPLQPILRGRLRPRGV